MEVILQAVNVAGNLSMVIVALALWRFDRRLVRLETFTFGPDGMRE